MREVHHLTYARLGDEPLSDLLGLCKSCHRAIHHRRDLVSLWVVFWMILIIWFAVLFLRAIL
jgi:hypothetical protein